MSTPRQDYSQREGPCIVEHRDRTWNKQPVYRSYSCWGCRFSEVDSYYGSQYCHHPLFYQMHGSKQFCSGGWYDRWKLITHWGFCPVLRLRGTTDQLPQPPKDENERGPEHQPRRVWQAIDGRVWPWTMFERPLRLTPFALRKAER